MTVNDWKQKFSIKVNELMRNNNMTQSQLAKSTGISKGRLSEYLSMKAMPTIFAVINIACVLDVSVSSITDFGERIDQGEVK